MLTYALFPQIGLRFLENRGNPDAFEPAPGEETEAVPPPAPASGAGASHGVYTVTVDGRSYVVEVSEGGDVTGISQSAPASSPKGEPVAAPLAGNIFKVTVKPGDHVNQGDVIVILEAMKMETEVRASRAGTVGEVMVAEGDKVAVGDTLMALG